MEFYDVDIELINWMVIKFISKALKRDKNHLVVRKTDDELTRYLKQKRI